MRYFTFEITQKRDPFTNERYDNYEDGYYVGYPQGNYRRYSLKKIKKDVANFQEWSILHLPKEPQQIASITNSSLFSRRHKSN